MKLHGMKTFTPEGIAHRVKMTGAEMGILEKENARALLVIELAHRRICVWCSTNFTNALVKLLQKQWSLNTEWLVHCKQTHGFEPEDVIDMLNSI